MAGEEIVLVRGFKEGVSGDGARVLAMTGMEYRAVLSRIQSFEGVETKPSFAVCAENMGSVLD